MAIGLFECILKQVELKATKGDFSCVKRTPKSKLRDVIARNLRRLRSERSWSQERLALESGLNRTYLSAVERSEQNISTDNIARLADALSIEAWVLLKPSD